MSFPLDLDEINEQHLAEELFRRQCARTDKKCSYCKRPVYETPCKQRLWHRPKIVVFCGSTREEFIPTWHEANRKYTGEGAIVLTVAYFKRDNPSVELKQQLDQLHLDKIRMADEVVVLNVNKYVGEGTKQEIEFAKRFAKPVFYWEED